MILALSSTVSAELPAITIAGIICGVLLAVLTIRFGMAGFIFMVCVICAILAAIFHVYQGA